MFIWSIVIMNCNTKIDYFNFTELQYILKQNTSVCLFHHLQYIMLLPKDFTFRYTNFHIMRWCDQENLLLCFQKERKHSTVTVITLLADIHMTRFMQVLITDLATVQWWLNWMVMERIWIFLVFLIHWNLMWCLNKFLLLFDDTNFLIIKHFHFPLILFFNVCDSKATTWKLDSLGSWNKIWNLEILPLRGSLDATAKSLAVKFCSITNQWAKRISLSRFRTYPVLAC